LFVGLASGRSLGGDWRRRPGRPRAHWTDQLRGDTGSIPAKCQPLETGHSTVPWWSDATARAGYAMTTTTTTICVFLLGHLLAPIYSALLHCWCQILAIISIFI